MICEDEAIIALDLQSRLMDMGFDVIGSYASQREAQRALRRTKPDMAIIDVELADGACTRLAGQLQEAGVYFAVLSGLTPANPPPEFASAPWLLKPVSDEALRAAIAAGPFAPTSP
jgi:two-component SAPR family response regulator